MQAAQTLVNTGLMVIANGGINAPWQVDAMQEVGVSAVGLGAVLWGIFPEDMLGFIWEHTDQY
jgi:putative N-acetylmannosamine-6-phosphate epimerase